MLTQAHDPYASGCSKCWQFDWLIGAAATVAILAANLGIAPARPQAASDQSQDSKKSDGSADEAAARQRLQDLDKQQQADDTASRQAEVSRLEATRDQLLAQLKSAQAELDAIQQQLRDLQAQRKSIEHVGNPADQHQVKALQIEVAMAEAQLDRDRLELERSRALFEKKAISNLQLQEAESNAQMDGLKVQRAQEELARARDEIAAQQRAASNTPVDATHAPASEPMARGDLDLVNLANSYANALGEVRLARAKLNSETANPAIAKAEAENAVSKYEMLRRIAEVALKQAQDGLNSYEIGFKQHVVSSAEVAQVAARVHILESILQTSADTPPKQ